ALKVSNKDAKIIYYRDFVIKGWLGIYEIEGDPRLLKLAYSAGLGAKNSQGFGMIDVIKEKDDASENNKNWDSHG
ncbi:MAG: CRISPR-associated endoribonuclease Cas6, partial [Thermacetogeniaceae bacterium]